MTVDPVVADRQDTLAFLESERRRYLLRPGQWSSFAVVDLLARALRERWGMDVPAPPRPALAFHEEDGVRDFASGAPL